MADPEIMTEAQAAAALRVSTKTLSRWRRAGSVSFDMTPGGRIRYRMEDLIALRRTMYRPANVLICPNMSGENEPGTR